MKVKRLSIAVVTVGMLVGSMAGAAAQEDMAAPDVESFRTKEVEPGVVRILDDNSGHDLTRKWPEMRRDIDHIAVGPSGQVWLSVTASGSDNDRLDGARLWPLGQAATYGPKDGAGKNHNRLIFGEDGRLWVIGNRAAVFDGNEWTSSPVKGSVTAPDGTVWLSGSGFGVESWDGAELTRHLENMFTDQVFAGPDGTIGVFAWDGIYFYDGTDWTREGQADSRRAVSPDGVLALFPDSGGGVRLHGSGEVATVLQGNRVNEITAAPDGSFWVAGGVGKSNGGVFRIDPAKVFAARAEAAAASEAEATAADEEAGEEGASSD